MVIRLSCFRVKAARRVELGCICLVWPSTSSLPLSHAVPTVMTTGPTTYQVSGPQSAHGMGVAVCGISVLRLGPKSTLGGRAEEDSEHEGYCWQPAEAQVNTACLPCSTGL